MATSLPAKAQRRIVLLFQDRDPELGQPFLVWPGELCAIGELMIGPAADRVQCLGDARFIGRREPAFRTGSNASRPTSTRSCGTNPRLLELQQALVDLIRELLEDPNQRSAALEKLKKHPLIEPMLHPENKERGPVATAERRPPADDPEDRLPPRTRRRHRPLEDVPGDVRLEMGQHARCNDSSAACGRRDRPGGVVCTAERVSCPKRPVPDLDTHYLEVVETLTAGRVTPFLGAGVNLAVPGRPTEIPWKPGTFLPSAGELAEELALRFRYPYADGEQPDLLRIAQYAAVARDMGTLYDRLRELFDADYPPTAVHEFFARLPRLLEEKGYRRRNLLIVTTNYDDALERAFREAGEPYDLIWYMADGETRGMFWQWPHNGTPEPIVDPSTCHELTTERRSVILKIHGAVDREDSERDSFVITEDHYIDYLTRTEISRVPVMLATTLKTTSFLFLGYSMRDWNMRVLMYRIWGAQKLRRQSWSIQVDASEIEKEFWAERGKVETHNVSLLEYIGELERRIQALEPSPNATRTAA